MTARFAGSRTLDERRRRWLASHEAEQSAPTRSRKSSETSEEESEAAQVQITHFPVRKVISSKGWKITLVAMVALLLGAGLISAAQLGTSQTESLGPGWTRLFPSDGGGLIRMFQAGLLIVSGQLALLVWWVRSRSLRDFDGQYHVWLWAAVTVFFTGMGVIGEWHRVWSDTFCWLSSADFPQREVLCWMLPGTLGGGVIWKKLRADMRDCQSSSLVFWAVGICYLGACAFRLRLDQTHLPEPTRELIGMSLQMLTCVGVFISFLAHARFVLHVSVEPPAARPSIWSKMFERVSAMVKKLPKPRFKFQWKSLLNFPKKAKSASDKAKPIRKDKKAKRQQKQTESSPSQNGAVTETEALSKPARKTSRRKSTKPQAKPKPTEQSGKEDSQAGTQEAERTPQQQTASQSRTDKTTKTVENSADKSSNNAKGESPKPKDSASAKSEQPGKAPEPEKTNESKSSASSEPQLRLDEPLDPEMLKGLSKKERRRLRKLHRDAQRKT